MTLIAQLSDLHLTVPGQRLGGRIDTYAAAGQALARVAALQPRPSLAVFSGDLTAHGDAAEYRALADLLRDAPFACALMPGNHDDPVALRAAFPAQPYAADRAHQCVPVAAGRLLLVDTTVAGAEGGAIDAATLAWLDAACPPAAPAILFLHHPPFATGMTGMDAIGLAGTALLATWLEAHPGVALISAGHVHRAVFSAFAGRPAVTAPSPAHQMALDLSGNAAALGYTLEPGGLLLIRWLPGAAPVVHLLPVAAAPVFAYD